MNKCKLTMNVVAMAFASIVRALRKLWAGNRVRISLPPQTLPQRAEVPRRRSKRRKEGRANTRAAKRRVAPAKKPDYRVAASGTTWLIDGANLLGSAGPENAEAVFSLIEKTMKERGYKVTLFLERRSLHWAIRNQNSRGAKRRLLEYAKSGSVALVDNESDLSMLQAARVIPGSVIVSRDHFRDYRSTFGDVLNAHKVVGFSCLNTDDKLVISIFGLRDAIVIPLTTHDASESEEPDGVDSQEGRIARRSWRHDDVKPGYLTWGERHAKKGDIKMAISCFGKLVEGKDAAGYRALAGLYEDSDFGKSRKYEDLAMRLEKRKKEESRRNLRICKERCRMNNAA